MRHGGPRGVFLALGSAVAFGSAGPFSKAILLGGAMSPLRLAQFRITMAAVVLLIIVGARRAGRPRSTYRWTRADRGLVLAYGALGFVAVQVCYFVAIDRLPVGVALLLEYISVVLVALYAALVQRRPQPRAVWLGVVLAVAGLLVLTQPWHGFRLDALGVVAGCGAAVGSAAYFLLGEHGTARLPTLELIAYSAATAAGLLAIAMPWWTFPFSALGGSYGFAGRSWPAWALLTMIVIVGTVVAYLLGVSSLRHLASPSATVIATLEILVGALAAWVFLDEGLTATELTGGGIIFIGVVVVAERARIPRGTPGKAAVD
ncbi:MAG: hypothetical protein QOJ62_2819 [Actinomycetota bacterium]|jgi:drug/metabolite transporter (DMT)-like permease|nr:hypothetical protein [Actinomycetota bacterium]